MRTFFTPFMFFLLVIFLNKSIAQTFLYESFSYNPDNTNGLSAQSNNLWKKINSGDSILVIANNLNYPGLSASQGNKIAFDAAGTDYYSSFSTQTSGSLFASFILNVSALGSLDATGSYFSTFLEAGSTSAFASCIWLKQSQNTGKYLIGISNRSSVATPVFYSVDLNTNQDYFITLSYEIVPNGTTNDVSKLWVNTSSFNGVMPNADVIATGGTDVSANGIGRFLLRQHASNTTPFIQFDELRIGKTWLDVTPCSSPTTYFADSDGDTFGDKNNSVQSCVVLNGYVTNDLDCNDNNAQITSSVIYYTDGDGDGFGSGNGQSLCQNPGSGYAIQTGDCNDSDNQVYPGASEICDGLDNDCDGIIDNGLTFTTYYSDNDGDGYGSGNGQSLCKNPGNGYVTVNGDCNDSDAQIRPGGIEICDDKDNDCNGIVDDGLIFVTYYSDNDNDGFGGGNGMSSCQNPGAGYVTIGGDCNDSDNQINPLAIEVCDGIDNDCDGLVDDSLTFATYYVDNDNDGFGGGTGQTLCKSPGQGYITIGGDCDDTDKLINPSATEICDGLDNDCDGLIDDSLNFVLYYTDSDKDGYGAGSGQLYCQNPGVSFSLNNNDCDDNNDLINPNVAEICDGIDNDCDGAIDEGLNSQIYYIDNDDDGYGIGNGQSFCQDPGIGYALLPGDCDDTDKWVNPDESEVCDGIDNNCDGTIDEGFNAQIYYVDLDNDGFGVGNGQSFCQNPGNGYALVAGDCDDNNNQINSNANEICDGIDNDCDGFVDEGLSTQTYFPDSDNDGFGTGNGQSYCQDPGTGFSLATGDCDDTNASINPGASDLSANGIDEDCDGIDGTLGIDEITNVKLTIHPNPSSGIFHLNFNQKFISAEIKLMDLNGKLIKTSIFSGNSIEMNESNLEKGCYFIQVISNGVSIIERVIVD